MYLRNENGVTLIEVLLSVVLLSIILATVMNFFPQMAFTNNVNENKNQAVNLAKSELLYWKEEVSVNFDDFFEESLVAGNPLHINNTYKYSCSEGDFACHVFDISNESENNEKFDVMVKVWEASDLENGATKAHKIHIQIIDETNNKPISETYGYVFIE